MNAIEAFLQKDDVELGTRVLEVYHDRDLQNSENKWSANIWETTEVQGYEGSGATLTEALKDLEVKISERKS